MQGDPLEVAAVGPARRLAAAALAGLVRRELADELALARRAEAARVADLVDAPVVAVEAEDDRADGPLLLARAPAHDDGVERPHPLDLHHPRALAEAVRARQLLRHDALLLAQPALRLRGRVHHRRELETADRLEDRAPLLVGPLQ